MRDGVQEGAGWGAGGCGVGSRGGCGRRARLQRLPLPPGAARALRPARRRRRSGPCPTPAKRWLRGPVRGRKLARAAWAPRPRVSARSRVASALVVVAFTGGACVRASVCVSTGRGEACACGRLGTRARCPVLRIPARSSPGSEGGRAGPSPPPALLAGPRRCER